MDYIKGKYKMSIFDGNSGYKVGLFRVKEASSNLTDLVNHTVTFSGSFIELNTNDDYIFNGSYVNHPKYGFQFQVSSYEKCPVTEENQVYEFLASSFVKGCGEKTAKKIVDAYGASAIEIIKEDVNNLTKIGIGASTAKKIYDSIIEVSETDDVIIYLKGLDFSVNEITKMLKLYGSKNIKNIINNDLYSLIDIVDFKKLDSVFFKLYDETNEMRILACIIECLKRLSFEQGDTYSYCEEIEHVLYNSFNIVINNLDYYLKILKNKDEIVIIDNKIYLYQNYIDEVDIAESLDQINNKPKLFYKDVDALINESETVLNIKYNDEQREAIKSGITNNVTIITGGPGTGKTTIINGILFVYRELNKLSTIEMNNKVALLAPTGRAAKRMSEATYYPASTIHRYLKWNMEEKYFGVDEYNRNTHRFLIVDEVSMIDSFIMASLLRGVYHDIKLVLVGDPHQLPSIGAGNVLKDLIDSNKFSHINLTNIYRQSKNSYIPILARDVKDVNVLSDLLVKKDDYNFLKCSKDEIKPLLTKLIATTIEKGLTEKDVEILSPMYKGENGIDNINMLLQSLYNRKDKSKNEYQYGSILFREGDKVINLVNNVEANVFNGDIGYIISINLKSTDDFMRIDFDGNIVSIKKDELINIRHAYALSIHKAQGSEFNHVIMIVSKEYNRMLYNNLIYTGISRAKKSLVIIGDDLVFKSGVSNINMRIRKTSLYK